MEGEDGEPAKVVVGDEDKGLGWGIDCSMLTGGVDDNCAETTSEVVARGASLLLPRPNDCPRIRGWGRRESCLLEIEWVEGGRVVECRLLRARGTAARLSIDEGSVALSIGGRLAS